MKRTNKTAGTGEIGEAAKSQKPRGPHATKVDKKKGPIEVEATKEGAIDICILGTSDAIILEAVNQKMLRELLNPSPKVFGKAREQRLKHDPMQEFQDSVYRLHDPKAPTLLALNATGFKKAMAGAATDLPGSSRAQIGRLTWTAGMRIPLYGIPSMMMSMVRSADQNKTPDVRTRACIARWAAIVRINYVEPNLTPKAIVNLMNAAGRTQGIGGWRQEKGSGNYGQFTVCDPSNLEFREIIQTGGRAAQETAMDPKNVTFYDTETEDLYGWFMEEVARRGHEKRLKFVA